MGGCYPKPGISGTKEEKLRNKKVRKVMDAAKKDDRKYLKLLLLGTGDSGKSTILKQLKRIQRTEFNPEEVISFKGAIYMNIVYSVKSIIEASKMLGVEIQDKDLGNFFLTNKNFSQANHIGPEFIEPLKRFWRDKGVENLWRLRASFPIYDNFSYFMENIERVCQGGDKFLPTFEDILRCKSRTTGVSFMKFKMFSTNFQVYDVGGQRGERKKWINCFDGVVTVLYVAAISEYDQNLFEEKSVNRTEEALNVWREIVNHPDFEDVGFVLFLNKTDLFQEKICNHLYRNPEKGFNESYEGSEPSLVSMDKRDEAIEQCKNHVQSRFLDLVEARQGLGLLTSHFTTALNTNTIENVLINSRATILNKNLFATGLPLAAAPTGALFEI